MKCTTKEVFINSSPLCHRLNIKLLFLATKVYCRWGDVNPTRMANIQIKQI